MAKIKVSTEPDGFHRSGYDPGDDQPIFENDGPSESDVTESLSIWNAIRAICKDTYGESYYFL